MRVRMPFVTSQRGDILALCVLLKNKLKFRKSVFTLRPVAGCGSFIMVWICFLPLMPPSIQACEMVQILRELYWLSAGELSPCLQSEFWLTLLSAEMKNLLLDPVAESAAGNFL